ncbi:MAG: ROK family protein [Nanoarchaeota archaeon]
MPNFICGVDVGATKIESYLFRFEKNTYKILSHDKRYTQVEDGKKAILKNIEQAIQKIIGKRKNIDAIGISLPGLIIDNRIEFLPNMKSLNEYDLAGHMSRKHKVPVQLRNDGDCFTLAESKFGAGKECQITAGMTIGSGVGGGLSINNEIVHNAMEVGHMTVVKGGKGCSCGGFGCLEPYINGNSITKRYYKKTKLVMRPKEILHLRSTPTRETIAETAEYVAAGIGNILTLVSPDCIVIGGGISKSRALLQKTRTILTQNESYARRSRDVKIRRTKLEGVAAPLGVAYEAARTLE